MTGIHIACVKTCENHIPTHLQWRHQQIHESLHDCAIPSSQASTQEGGGQCTATHSQCGRSTWLERSPQGSNKLRLQA
jgi:hypothetical protein